jgi:hypothetical protein
MAPAERGPDKRVQNPCCDRPQEVLEGRFPSGSIVALLRYRSQTPAAQSSHCSLRSHCSFRSLPPLRFIRHWRRSACKPRRLNLRIAALPLALLVSLASSASLYPPQAALSFGTRFASLLRLALLATGGASATKPSNCRSQTSDMCGE